MPGLLREVSSLRFLMRPHDGDVRQRLSIHPPMLIGDCVSPSAVAASPSDRGGDDGREQARLGEEDGQVLAGREVGEVVEPELRHLGAKCRRGRHLRYHLPRRLCRCRHAE
ncbi:hypothetical protein E2562_014764 [Oryza meyeriana var. granulata]|uniref:Uncharacterized protein n=1 Tax=Oryza meyeriana var. granulata TaxID=110450 RepID=A0A6G1BLG2_9ORYZ|nr:hypothetical protein E2562_014764 [Oryza meyeriana var. granulata]